MTKELLNDLTALKEEAVRIYKASTPVASGYQKAHIYAKDLPNGGFVIIANTDYVQYTTDSWSNGSNPNENWDKEASEYTIQQAKKILSKHGKLK